MSYNSSAYCQISAEGIHATNQEEQHIYIFRSTITYYFYAYTRALDSDNARSLVLYLSAK